MPIVEPAFVSDRSSINCILQSLLIPIKCAHGLIIGDAMELLDVSLVDWSQAENYVGRIKFVSQTLSETS